MTSNTINTTTEFVSVDNLNSGEEIVEYLFDESCADLFEMASPTKTEQEPQQQEDDLNQEKQEEPTNNLSQIKIELLPCPSSRKRPYPSSPSRTATESLENKMERIEDKLDLLLNKFDSFIKEYNDYRIFCTCNYKQKYAENTLNLPKTTLKEFLALDASIEKDEKIEEALKTKFISNQGVSFEKFLRLCLSDLMTAEVAASFSWTGIHGNLEAGKLNSMQILIDIALERFSSSRIQDIVTVIKKWYQNSKGRARCEK